MRGKKWEYTLQLPSGETKPILAVPRYDFNWQTYYMFSEPLQVPKGAKIVSTAWYDNSAANKNNPDAKVDVKWGDQTWEEMQDREYCQRALIDCQIADRDLRRLSSDFRL